MANQSFVTVTLKKEVADKETAEIMIEMVKTKLADKPDIKITGHFTAHFAEGSS